MPATARTKTAISPSEPYRTPSTCGNGPIRADSTHRPPTAYPAAPSMNMRSPLSLNRCAAQITTMPTVTSDSDWYKNTGWNVA